MFTGLSGSNGFISIKNANVNNLKKVNVDIPLGRFVTVTGVSGSGKSSLIFGCVAEAAEAYFHQPKKNRNPDILGLESLNTAVIINQQSIGRSNRPNAATYMDLFTDIRDLFASLPETKVAGISAKHFLPDVEVVCPACRGKRYQKPVLNIRYKGHTISDVLEQSIDEALELFKEEGHCIFLMSRQQGFIPMMQVDWSEYSTGW